MKKSISCDETNQIPVIGQLNHFYSKRPKSERSDFGQDRFSLVTKSFGFQKSNFFLLNCPNRTSEKLNKLVLLGYQTFGITGQNFVRFVKPNVPFSDVHCICNQF